MEQKNNSNNFENEFPCQLKQLKLSCYGCCGDDWTAKSEIENDIWLNSRDFKEIYTESDKSEDDLKFFKDRYAKDEVSQSGVCMNLVDFGDGCLACPLHPMVNSIVDKSKVTAPKEDLRVGHCDTNYECETVKYWRLFNSHQRKEFIKWLNSKNYSNYKYSMKNVSGKLIKQYFDEIKRIE